MLILLIGLWWHFSFNVAITACALQRKIKNKIIIIYIIQGFSTTIAVFQRSSSGSDDVYTDAIRPITCHSQIYGTHHFGAGGQELLPAIILRGLHWWINAGPCALSMMDTLFGYYFDA